MVVVETESTLGIGPYQSAERTGRSQRTTQDLRDCSLKEHRLLVYTEGQWRLFLRSGGRNRDLRMQTCPCLPPLSLTVRFRVTLCSRETENAPRKPLSRVPQSAPRREGGGGAIICLFICMAQERTQAGHTAGEHLDLPFQVTQLVSIWVRALCL